MEEQNVEIVKLRSKLRKLEQESSYNEIFDTYEREQNRLSAEVARLLNENIELQEKIDLQEKYRGKIGTNSVGLFIFFRNG